MVGRGRPRDAGVEARVLEAAMTEMRARGYDGLSVDRVAERAGVGKTTIYRRWPSKAELVMAMITELTSGVPFDPSGIRAATSPSSSPGSPPHWTPSRPR